MFSSVCVFSNDVCSVMMCSVSTCVSQMEVPEKVESPHVIVTRRLRSRRK